MLSIATRRLVMTVVFFTLTLITKLALGQYILSPDVRFARVSKSFEQMYLYPISCLAKGCYKSTVVCRGHSAGSSPIWHLLYGVHARKWL